MSRARGWTALLAGIALAALTVVCVAQTENADEAAPKPPAKTEVRTRVDEARTETTLWGIIQQGGVIMFPLGLLSVAAIGLIAYGFVAVQTSRMLHPELVPSLKEELGNRNLDGVRGICNSAPSLLTNTLNAGLDRISDGVLDVPSMEKAMEEASIHETTEGLKPIKYLSIIAQIAPMLGLLGTVSGMIKAFQKIGLGGMGDAEKLAGNIGEAMVTTATGLIIGIPAMFFYFYLKSKYTSNVSQLARILGDLMHHLVAACRRRDTARPAGAAPQQAAAEGASA